RLFPLLLAGAMLAPCSTFAQSMPLCKSYTQTGNIRDIAPSTENDNSVAFWLGKKADTQNGRLQNPVINQRVLTTGPLQMSDIDTNYVLGTRLCSPSPVAGLMTTTTNIQGLLKTSNFPKLADTRSVAYWLNSGAATMLSLGWKDGAGDIASTTPEADVQAFIAQSAAAGPEAIEIGMSPYITPNVPTTDYTPTPEGQLISDAIFYKPNSDTVTLPGGKQAKTLWALGYRPQIAFMDIGFNATIEAATATDNHSTTYTALAETAVADVQKSLPSIKQVVPFMMVGYNPGRHASSYDPLVEFAQDPYYANDRAFYKSVGALSIDDPPSMLMGDINGGQNVGAFRAPYLPDAYLRFSAGQVIWAKQNNITVYWFSSPFQQNGSSPQYGYDTIMRQNTMALAHYLAAHSIGGMDALPNYWMVGQYSNSAVTNSVGNEADPESISRVTLDLLSAGMVDATNLTARAAGVMSAQKGICPRITAFANGQTSTPTLAATQGHATAPASSGRYGYGDVVDGLRIDPDQGLQFIDNVYKASSTAAPMKVNGIDDSSGNRGLMWANRNFEEMGDGYHFRTWNAGINGFNPDGTPRIDATQGNSEVWVDYAGGHFTFAFASKNVYQAALDLTLDSAKFTVPV
ncbi:hypothetical protein HKD19_14830, partial [Gluconobacter sp. LMG 1745]|nr:hypothetical protein [Gluconobacter cadivus]